MGWLDLDTISITATDAHEWSATNEGVLDRATELLRSGMETMVRKDRKRGGHSQGRFANPLTVSRQLPNPITNSIRLHFIICRQHQPHRLPHHSRSATPHPHGHVSIERYWALIAGRH